MDQQQNLPTTETTEKKANASLLPAILLGVVLVLIAVLFALTSWGYHNSKFPYQFDNFVQRTGLWRVYGSKTYEPVDVTADISMVDPRLENVVDETVIRYTLGGLILEIEHEEDTLTSLRLMDEGGGVPVILSPTEVKAVHVKECPDYENCEKEEFQTGTLEDVEPGLAVIVLERTHGDDWVVADLSVTMYPHPDSGSASGADVPMGIPEGVVE